ncbi:MAG: nitrous oxide reductase family maturation protein NosD [Anaerolineae bacterium]|nr:nitrous oxide reductase family maturation protein NosD [Anaerolineae bacterium]MCB9132164.1 nitrous oxide reductase family maturation protein NosD [Anaerolineales bacterium]MCB0230724.1 nitrous oxide reductase family maturation protein NosD [Anaerolineae bacterium]MCB0236499.1 nitrous oxide reductase family maturation protein NosD [Anaerolineae bacterium]MCB0237733.1 nitrous oxide reductase family maturation protein NosD [Anaerolineae bacterium]
MLSFALIAAILAIFPFAAAQPFDLQAALAGAQAGDTIVVPAGNYAGPLVIDTPVTLIGAPGERPVIDAGGQGRVITINAPDVTIRGFDIRGSGASLDREDSGITSLAARTTVEDNHLEDVLFGIYLQNAPDSIVRGNTVVGKPLEMGVRGDGLRLWYSAGSLVEGNRVHDSRDMIVWYSPDSVIRGNTVERSRYGLHFMVNENVLIEENILRDNSVGIYLMYGDGYTVRNNLLFNNRGQSGYGLGIKDVDNAVVEGNYFVANRVGIYNDHSPLAPGATTRTEDNLFAYNDIALWMLPLVEHNTIAGNVFQENGEQVALAGEGVLHNNSWSEAGRGNYWSDYAGYDANGDAVGDVPYVAQSLYEDLLAKNPELRLFQLSPATDAIDLAARAFPLFQPRPKMADEHPLMAPPALPTVPGLAPPPLAANLAVAAGMLLLAGLLLVLGTRRSWRNGI